MSFNNIYGSASDPLPDHLRCCSFILCPARYFKSKQIQQQPLIALELYCSIHGKLCQLHCCWKPFRGVFAQIMKPLTKVHAIAHNRGMDLLKVIQERRSVRKYKDTPVPDEIIREILETARRSPSWANTQVWRFIVVKDQKIKEQLRDALSPTNPARQAFVDAPVIICVAAQRGRSGFSRGEAATDKGDWFMFDCGIAMEHIVLAAWNFGLGTVHVGSFDAKKTDEILHIPEGHNIVEMTPLGYFDDPTTKQTPRKPLSEIVFLNTFGEPLK